MAGGVDWVGMELVGADTACGRGGQPGEGERTVLVRDLTSFSL